LGAIRNWTQDIAKVVQPAAVVQQQQRRRCVMMMMMMWWMTVCALPFKNKLFEGVRRGFGRDKSC